MGWILPKKSDLVLQLHLRATGKREKVQVSVGFYFSNKPPTRLPAVLCLRSTAIDIPAGESNYSFENSYTLPVEGDVLAVLPHQHYLGKELRAWAELPDGTRRDLLWIKRWDFNWQGAYRYATPVPLPKGATIRMRYSYDNSANNARNPNQPPKRVRYGLESSDEMGEFWLQFLPSKDADAAVLERDFIAKVSLPDKISRARVMLERDPHDAATRIELAIAHLFSGHLQDAEREALQALQDDPKLARAHYILGDLYSMRGNALKATAAYEACVALEPDNSEAQNNLGFVLLAQGKAAEALPHLEKAVQLNPDDALAKKNLEKARGQLGK
jgi:tetratricopeptide (TPR) repeat protein